MRTPFDLSDDLARGAKAVEARTAPRCRPTPPLIGTRTGDGYDVTADDIADAVGDGDRADISVV